MAPGDEKVGLDADAVALAERFLDGADPPLLFITGEPGTGKSHTARALIERARRAGQNVLAVSYTGTAAANVGGRTIHRAFGVRVDGDPGPLDWARQADVARCDLLVVDEVSMVSAWLLDTMDAKMRALRERFDAPFGGAAVLLVGDLGQLPPVGDDARPVHEAEAWPLFHCLLLRRQHRILEGAEQGRRLERLLRCVRGLSRVTDDVRDAVRAVVERDGGGGDRPPTLWLCDKNEHVDLHNARRLDELRREEGAAWSRPCVLFQTGSGDTERVARDAAQALGCDGDAGGLHELAVGAPVVFVVNVPQLPLLSAWSALPREHRAKRAAVTHWPTVPGLPADAVVALARDSRAVTNGTRGVVSGFVDAPGAGAPLPVVRLGGHPQGGQEEEVVALPQPWSERTCAHADEEDEQHRARPHERCWVSAWAVPLRLAWATTVHKAQGLTVPVGTTVRVQPGCGSRNAAALYVALSRVQALEQLDLSDWTAADLLRRMGGARPGGDGQTRRLLAACKAVPGALEPDSHSKAVLFRVPVDTAAPPTAAERARAFHAPRARRDRRARGPTGDETLKPETEAWIRARVADAVKEITTVRPCSPERWLGLAVPVLCFLSSTAVFPSAKRARKASR